MILREKIHQFELKMRIEEEKIVSELNWGKEVQKKRSSRPKMSLFPSFENNDIACVCVYVWLNSLRSVKLQSPF